MATPLFIPNYINRCIYYKHKNTYFIPTIRFTCRKSRQTYENRSLLQPIILQDARMRAYDVTADQAADWLIVSAISHLGGAPVTHPVLVENKVSWRVVQR